jgi:uncharacterized tellurite resistance protein B-like protein
MEMEPITERTMEQIIAILKAGFEEIKADREERKAEREFYREILTAIFGADRGKMKAYPEQIEANPERTVSEAVHQEIP